MELDIQTNKHRTIIRAHGIGFILVICLCLMFIIPSIILMICFFIPNTEMFHNWLYFVITLLALVYFVFEFITLFTKGYVLFDDDKFITKGKYSKKFPPINKNCEEFTNFKLTSYLSGFCLELTLKSNQKILVHVSQFSKKQVIKILQEIKNRGGFVNQDIELNKYYV